MDVYPNFGHPALTSSFTKYKYLQMKNGFATIVNGLSKNFSVRMAREHILSKLGQSVDVWAHYHMSLKMIGYVIRI